MCTAISHISNDHYFGRTLDYELSFGERVTITPKNYTFRFKNKTILKSHYAIIGITAAEDSYPLYYDAVNEKGLCMAGLNFPVYADYKQWKKGKENIAPFELIPYVLSVCKDADEGEKLLKNVNIVNIPFNEKYPLTPLHWMVSDKKRTIVIEQVKDGLKIYDNPIGVLTNSPQFEYHLLKLSEYMNLSPNTPENRLSKKLELSPYSRGMGAIGLPGDWSSSSRFVRAAFIKENSECGKREKENVNQFFHIMDSVSQVKGCNILENGKSVYTIYSSCCNADKGTYYCCTYTNREIRKYDLFSSDLEGDSLINYPLSV